jgi:hypothetical protein
LKKVWGLPAHTTTGKKTGFGLPSFFAQSERDRTEEKGIREDTLSLKIPPPYKCGSLQSRRMITKMSRERRRVNSPNI